MKPSRTFVEGVATCGFIGKIPFAPGTFGSIPGLLFYLLLSRVDPFTAAGCITGFVFLAVWIAGKAEQSLKLKDPGCIVIDEIAGMAATFFALPLNLYLGVIGFVLFRVLDILKPFPIGYLDRNLKGGFGVVMDDVAAGIISNLVLHALLYFMPCFISGT
ncbi:MAG: phosphatidylglycerophosphatase A [Desulfosalsimonadaceae bacterium]|nr:phosphatidylglycerophosphatase A [Desulfosalsimonadaceae bacterium]